MKQWRKWVQWRDRLTTRPPMWMRVVNVVLAVVAALSLTGAQTWRDVAWRCLMCFLLLLSAITSPRVYEMDPSWAEEHPLSESLATLLALGVIPALFLSYVIPGWLAISITLPLAALVFALTGKRQRRENVATPTTDAT